jgi:hypothetical protein
VNVLSIDTDVADDADDVNDVDDVDDVDDVGDADDADLAKTLLPTGLEMKIVRHLRKLRLISLP